MTFRFCKKCRVEKAIENFPYYNGKSRRFTCIECRNVAGAVQKQNRRNADPEYYIREAQRNIKWRTGENYRNHLLKKREKSKSRYYDDLLVRIGRIVYAAERRAIAKGIDFSITIAMIIDLIKANDFKCSITGIKFELEQNDKYVKNPRSPSLDRKDSNKGYTPDNIQIVCCWYNMMKNEWSDEDVRSFVLTAYQTIVKNGGYLE